MILFSRALLADKPGAAILGDGRVGLILDVGSLVHAEGRAFSQAN